LTVFLTSALRALAGAKAAAPPTVRWAEGEPGCTFTRGDDGIFRYGLWKGDVGLIAAVDSQELEKARKRPEPMFGILLTIRYRGSAALDLATGPTSLEFVKHHKLVRLAFDSSDLANRLQTRIEDLRFGIRREVKKHPEKKQEQEALLAAHEKNVTELQDFLSTYSFHAGTLNGSNRQISGWVFFSSPGAWIGEWKKPEEFLLRVPLDGQVFAIPITLPPREGDLVLRRRPGSQAIRLKPMPATGAGR
jgi:hypothetical protein